MALHFRLAALAALALVSGAPEDWTDCSAETDGHLQPRNGTFGPIEFVNASFLGKPVYALLPTAADGRSFPLMAFMHGSTGQFEMYQQNLYMYATHGFVVVFPFVKGPEADKSPFTTNTDGMVLLNGVLFALEATKDPSSPLYSKIDESRIVVAGHSMGATDSIEAAFKLPVGSGAKLAITQHPGICGPFGPPPLPSTWKTQEFAAANAKVPFLFTTATNDAAFWPAPQTAAHEMGCFKSAVNGTAAFVQFSAAACAEDHQHDPFPDSGHNCPFKAEVEAPWVLTSMKLYAQQDGRQDSGCFQMLWSNATGSLTQDPRADSIILHPPAINVR